MQYFVLFPISPDQGPLILPAAEGEPPTLVDEDVLFAGADAEFLTREERAKILIDKGIIVPSDQANRIPGARAKLREVEAEAAASLKQVTTKKDT